MTISGQELADLMQASAQDAVVFARNEFDIELDGSDVSVALADEALSKASARIKSASEEQTIFTISTIFGAYVGEVFRRQHGGEWIYDTSIADAPAVYLQFNELTFAFTGVAYQRLMHEPHVSLAKYLEAARKQAGLAAH
ncbi:MAG: hypothetical protein C0463_08760 [Idiomarina sp.]|uniref:Uncharacterized protein n=2 Tax=Aliidiomarina maris TaxID=531312 RepID=A0A327XAM9_9GAMM|nr:hypothetical protein [Idiomarina sp.]RAK00727.1 hypothetical protein B0I24_102152 [Aliidiomarina maris]RUO27274.1 hypothetical protein CWE07_04820 [Aliidiomarina maris]